MEKAGVGLAENSPGICVVWSDALPLRCTRHVGALNQACPPGTDKTLLILLPNILLMD